MRARGAPEPDPAADIIGLYERHASGWDKRRNGGVGPSLERGWLDRFCLACSPGSAVLDIGCGSGRPIAAELLARGFRVTGIDASPTLVALCRASLPCGDWIVGDMRGMSLRRKFGGLLAWHSFFHLTSADQRNMFRRFRDHALPGAALMFTSGPEAGERIGSFEGEPLFHASLDPEEYRTLLAREGFTVLAHRSEDPECGLATVWLARLTG